MAEKLFEDNGARKPWRPAPMKGQQKEMNKRVILVVFVLTIVVGLVIFIPILLHDVELRNQRIQEWIANHTVNESFEFIGNVTPLGGEK